MVFVAQPNLFGMWSGGGVGSDRSPSSRALKRGLNKWAHDTLLTVMVTVPEVVEVAPELMGSCGILAGGWGHSILGWQVKFTVVWWLDKFA